ncbi:MAG TPA: hypothetical protein VGA33_00165 [Thermoanaerobaculia bacterium]
MWSPCVPVAAVSVGGGGFCSSFFLPVGATVSVAVGAVWVGGGAAVSVLLFIGGFVVVGWVERGRGRGVGAEVAVGKVPATVPGCCVVVAVVAVPGSVKAVVVSTFVPVIVELVIAGGGFSPGALIVDVTPVAEPSCTTSYCG